MLKENEKYMLALTQVFQVIMNVQDCYQQCKLLKLTMFILRIFGKSYLLMSSL